MVRQREAQAVAAATGFGALAAGLGAETRDAGVLVVSAIVLAGSLPAVAAAVAAADPRLRLVRRDGAAALYRVA